MTIVARALRPFETVSALGAASRCTSRTRMNIVESDASLNAAFQDGSYESCHRRLGRSSAMRGSCCTQCVLPRTCASARCDSLPAVVLVRCQVVVLDAEAFPAWVEARFDDADGREVRIADKEPMFRDGSDPPGRGWVRGTELRRQGSGSLARVLVSLAVPDALETTAGADSVEVLARDVEAAG